MTATWFAVYCGIFEHRHRLGGAIWEFMWLLDRTASEIEVEAGERVGIVLGGHPVPAHVIAKDLQCSHDLVSLNLSRLIAGGYIDRQPHPRLSAYSYRVRNSKKWMNRPVEDSRRPSKILEGGIEDPRRGIEDPRSLIRWEIPRLCRGGSRSLTDPGVRFSPIC